jgi:branched-chain amino acid transport system substrate-binding protein
MGKVMRASAVAIVLAGVFALAQGAEQPPIKIGAINPFSGPMAQYGAEVTRGFELAADQVNASGGVLGRKVEIVQGDASNAQQGIQAVDLLMNKDKVDLFEGTYTSAISNAASDAAARHNKVYLETIALAEELTDRGLPNYMRTGPNAGMFANATADTVKDLIAPALKKDVKSLKVWLEHEDSIYGTSIAQKQKKLLEGLGVKIVGVGAHSGRAIDLTDSILRAKKAEPDIYIETGYVADGNLLLKTAKEHGFKPAVTLFIGTGDTPETLSAVGQEMVDGMLVIAYPRTDVNEAFAPGVKAYLTAYRNKYKGDPIQTQSLTSYVGTLMLFDAIKAAGSLEPDKVRAAAAKMDKPVGSYPNGFGVKFDDKFQNTRAIPTTVQWQGGKPVTVFPKAAAPAGAALKSMARGG